jgi:S-ribosylhomocysteine lyase
VNPAVLDAHDIVHYNESTKFGRYRLLTGLRRELGFKNRRRLTTNKIQSFSVDHDLIVPGIYISRIDGDVTTYDMRTRKPNGGDYMDNLTMHSVEHMFATYIRNGEIGGSVLYFGPMGCATGFYLLVRCTDNAEVLSAVKNCLEKIIAHEGEVFGASRTECGNYRNLSLDAAKQEARRYLDCLEAGPVDFRYKERS